MSIKYIKLVCLFSIFLIIDNGGHQFLKYYCNKGFGLTNHSNILMVGHSHLAMGVDADALSHKLNLSITKYSRAGVDIKARHLMANQFINSSFADSLKLVVFCVDVSSFTVEGLSDNSYTLFYPWMDNPDYNKFVYTQATLGEYLFHKVFRLSRYNQDLLSTAIKGFWGKPDVNLKTNRLFIEKDPNVLEGISIRFNNQLMNELKNAVEEVSNKNIKVVLLQTPIAKYLLNGRNAEVNQVEEFFQSLTEKDKVYYLNYTDEIYDKYDLFFNSTHLNVRGQEVFTNRLSEELEKIKIN